MHLTVHRCKNKKRDVQRIFSLWASLFLVVMNMSLTIVAEAGIQLLISYFITAYIKMVKKFPG